MLDKIAPTEARKQYRRPIVHLHDGMLRYNYMRQGCFELLAVEA